MFCNYSLREKVLGSGGIKGLTGLQAKPDYPQWRLVNPEMYCFRPETLLKGPPLRGRGVSGTAWITLLNAIGIIL
jgi:hypothetical protein